jgi:hypothetical protein
MELFEVHYTAPRRAPHLNFVQSSGEGGHSGSGLLTRRIYNLPRLSAVKKIAVNRGCLQPRKSDLLFDFINRRSPRSPNTAVYNGNRKPRKSDRLFGFINRRSPRSPNTAVCNGFKNLINGLTTVIDENRLKPRFHTPHNTAVFLYFFFRG